MIEPGQFPIEMDGRWDIDDLTGFSEAFKETYAYFYAVHPSIPKDRDRLRLQFTRYFWTNEYRGRTFAQNLYYAIPTEHKLQIMSIKYASPGLIVLAGVITVLTMLAKCVSAWTKAGSDVLELIERVGKFFKERRLNRPMRRFSLDEIRGMDLDAARELLREMGEYMGFSQTEVDNLVDITGNPISALRLMSALAHEARRLSDLVDHGKLKLPDVRDPDPSTSVRHRLRHRAD